MSTRRWPRTGAEKVRAEGGATSSDHHPFTGDLVAIVAAGRPVDVAQAVGAADKPFTSRSESSPSDWRTVFLAAADRVDARAEELAGAMTSETRTRSGR